MKKVLLFLLASFIISCQSDNDYNPSEVYHTLTLELKTPSDLQNVSFKEVNIEYIELNTKKQESKIVPFDKTTLSLLKGSYEIRVNAKITYQLNGNTQQGELLAVLAKVNIVGDTSEIVELSLKTNQSDLIIQEIFFTGNRTPENKLYNGDKYFKIYNNTNEILYADGLILAQSEFLTTTKEDNITPDVMQDYFSVSTMNMIEGDGDDYPIKPGEYIVIADNAINHKENNPNSLDLSNANFEFFYSTTRPNYDVDNPQVKNLFNLYGLLVPHDRGFYSYAIFRLKDDVKVDKFLVENKYNYTKTYANGKQVVKESYKIPNHWVVDAVNLSAKDLFEWIVTNPTLDSGFTYCSIVDRDQNRYGRSVIRKKLLTNPSGQVIYQDTNNSTEDFLPLSEPSLK